MYDLDDYPIIGRLEKEDIAAIAPFLKVNEYDSEAIILQQNQIGTDFHIILSGILDVYVEQKSKVHVATLKSGQFFGEMSCLAGSAVSATVQANGPVKTVSMSKEGMLTLMDKSVVFRNTMMEEMIQRIANSNDRVMEEHRRSAVALQQLQMEQETKYGRLVGISDFMLQLKNKLEKLAAEQKPLYIFGETGVGKTHIAWEIHRLSPQARQPILVVDGAHFHEADWEEKVQTAMGGMIILERAELLGQEVLKNMIKTVRKTRLIMTGSKWIPLDITALEVIPLRDRKEDISAYIEAFITEAGFPQPDKLMSQEALHLIYNFPFLAGNIAELKQVILDALIRSNGTIIRTTHLRFGSARKRGSRPVIGLALGSGSVKGVAHVGVIKALEEAGIPIDLIAGTSAGALVGSIYVGGQPISNFEKVLPTVRWGQLIRMTIPRKGIVNNHLMSKFIEKYIGSVEFKDLPIPFAAVASDAVNGEAVILNEGSVSQAVCASTAIPGVMHPVQLEDKSLLDGAVAQPVPVALAKSMGADIVIAVDVSTPRQVKNEPGNFISTILNTIDIMSERIVSDELQLADIVIKPWLANTQLTFKDSAAYIQRGYEVTKEIIPEIKQKIDGFMKI